MTLNTLGYSEKNIIFKWQYRSKWLQANDTLFFGIKTSTDLD